MIIIPALFCQLFVCSFSIDLLITTEQKKITNIIIKRVYIHVYFIIKLKKYNLGLKGSCMAGITMRHRGRQV